MGKQGVRQPLRAAGAYCQGAPSAIRCIETLRARQHPDSRYSRVRGHPASSGALRPPTCAARRRLTPPGQGAPSTIRCIETLRARQHPDSRYSRVRGHPASSGALRPPTCAARRRLTPPGQGAPSTIRCIETLRARQHPDSRYSRVRGHPASSGALRPHRSHRGPRRALPSGSTQHHQVH